MQFAAFAVIGDDGRGIGKIGRSMAEAHDVVGLPTESGRNIIRSLRRRLYIYRGLWAVVQVVMYYSVAFIEIGLVVLGDGIPLIRVCLNREISCCCSGVRFRHVALERGIDR